MFLLILAATETPNQLLTISKIASVTSSDFMTYRTVAAHQVSEVWFYLDILSRRQQQ